MFQATYRMGGQIFGQKGITFEAYFDGLDDGILRDELKRNEDQRKNRSQHTRLKERYGRKHRCYDSEDCSPGERCVTGFCEGTQYWDRFRDHGEVVVCEGDDVCVDGAACVLGSCRTTCDDTHPCGPSIECRSLPCRSSRDCGSGQCVDGRCQQAVCVSPCGSSSPCSLGQTCGLAACGKDNDCDEGPCIEGTCAMAGLCVYLRCVQNQKEHAINANPELRRGELPNLCENGIRRSADSDLCAPGRCPYGTYCAVHRYFAPGDLWRDRRGDGYCEQPIPIVLNPMILELFNMVLQSTMDRTQLGSVDTLLGYAGSVTFGQSFYKETVKDRVALEKRLEIAGFSSKAMEAGATMPMEYVRRANARYKGKEATREFDTFVMQLTSAEHLPSVMERLDEYNIQLSRRSAEAEKFRVVLLVAIAIFFIMASIILGIAAVNISHTFLMVIFERKREIGILRALGATKMDIRAMFLGESLLIGLTGGVLGNGIALGMSALADFLAGRYIGNFPFQPDTFFVYCPQWIAASFGFALFFSLAGAFFPANQAARMDPARTLTLG
jgi:hypothetical protein